jgi:hypothetical protein
VASHPDLIGLLVAASLAAGAVALVIVAIHGGSTSGAAAIAGIATVSAAYVLRAFERRKVMEEVRREQLTDIYMDLAEVLHGKTDSPEGRQELMRKFMRKSLIYASAGTVKAFDQWSSRIPDENESDDSAWSASSLRYEAFVKAMRKDLGISNWNLQDGDLIRIAIEDFEVA